MREAGWIDKWVSAAGGALVGALITGIVSMAMFTSRMVAVEQRIATLENSQDRQTGATEKLTDATHELTMEVRLLRQRLDRIDPDGRR